MAHLTSWSTQWTWLRKQLITGRNGYYRYPQDGLCRISFLNIYCWTEYILAWLQKTSFETLFIIMQTKSNSIETNCLMQMLPGYIFLTLKFTLLLKQSMYLLMHIWLIFMEVFHWLFYCDLYFLLVMNLIHGHRGRPESSPLNTASSFAYTLNS